MNLTPTLTRSVTVSAIAVAASLTGVLLEAQIAGAASLTHETASFSFNEDSSEDTFFDVGSGLLPYFNASLGTLNSVTYQILGDSTASITITNDSKKKATVEASTSTYGYGYFRPQTTYTFRGFNQGAQAYVNGTLDKKGTPGATLTDTNTNNFNLSYSPSTLTDSDYLKAFTGTGNFAVDFHGYLQSAVFTTVPKYSVTSAATSGLKAKITYDYTPIPTPALLPGLVAMGVGVLRNRKVEVETEAEVDSEA